jgi:uncharacterized NAD(P)/FAD-binding protein YdhS
MNSVAHNFPTKTVVIIGGGLSGAAVAFRLASTAAVALKVVVIEPRKELGRGLAYSTSDDVHRLNVPHVKMSLQSDVPLDFAKWLTGVGGPTLPPHSATLAGHIFAPRAVFGSYVQSRLSPFLKDGRIEHVQTAATAITAEGQRHRITLGDGQPDIIADTVVLAIAHPEPSVPAQLAPLAGSPGVIRDPFRPTALDAVARDERVLVVGTGLTSADILATLERRGHVGPIHVLSRHGWRSKPHGPTQAETAADFASDPARTALALLRRVRHALKVDAAAGLTWHAVFDRLRAQGPAIWAALPLPERRRFLRHLRGLWDVHRFRIAPQTLETVERLERSQRVRFLIGRLKESRVTPQAIDVEWRPRGTRVTEKLSVDRIILATGPDHARVTETNALLAQARKAGLITPDPLGLGLHVTLEGRAIRPAGQQGSIFVAGPLARGTAGELMGVPEITGWAEHITRQVAVHLAEGLPQP